jgi:hypothetical protein
MNVSYNWWGTTSCVGINNKIGIEGTGQVYISPPLNNSYPGGSPIVEICDDGIDNDCDGDIDTDDDDCKICGIEATNINFPDLVPGETSGNGINTTISMPPPGNTPVTPDIEGEVWTDGGSNQFAIESTHWYLTDEAYDSMTPLTGSPVTLVGIVGPGSPLDVYFKLKIPDDPAPAAVSYTQQITFTVTC